MVTRRFSCTADPELHCQGVGGGCSCSVGLKYLGERTVLRVSSAQTRTLMGTVCALSCVVCEGLSVC